jgi:2-oxoglutarate ferredoxin oxidoreductase subunit delta
MKAKNKNIVIEVNQQWCKGCSICVEFCPHDVLMLKDGHAEPVNLEACTACKLCEIRCPDFAISVITSESKQIMKSG